MSAGSITLIGGGVRSGKSAFALALARRLGTRRAFVATAQAFDDEMRARIDRHVAERAGEFVTVEAPLALPEALEALPGFEAVVVDCLTLWISNLLLQGESEAEILDRTERLAAALEARACHVLLVTNEVGMGVVPESALGRRFRDVAGRVHQRISATADALYFAAMGTILRLRPGPVAVESLAGLPARPAGGAVA